MNSTTSQIITPLQQASLTLLDYVKIIALRKWWLIFLFFVGMSISIVYSYSLPDLYRSTTMIMVERQRIPESYVQSTITSSIQDRLNTISQQILSRTNLEGIIKQFSLNKEDEFIPLSAKLNRKIVHFTGLDFNLEKFFTHLGTHKSNTATSFDDIVESMRQSTEVRVVGGNNAFTLTYAGRDPHTVMSVTNALASLFIEENLKIREQYAEGTSEFLTNELSDAKVNLEHQEKVLKEFKENHMGALPEQIETNLKTLDRLQSESQTINNDLRSAEDRKTHYNEQLKEYERQLIERQRAEREQGSPQESSSIDSAGESQILGLERSRQRLTEELTRLSAQFNENYPDILSLKSQIREVEARLAGESAPLKLLEETSSNRYTKAAGDGRNPQSPQLKPATQSEGARLTLPPSQSIRVQLQSTQTDIDFLRERQKRTAATIKEYEKRVEETFTNQQKLVSITRGYEMSQRNYQNLLQKLLNAKVAENLERRQKGEQFRVLDPGNLPQKPYTPNRPKLMGFGSLLSIGLGIGLILIKEQFRPLYRKTEDIHSHTDLPTLASIPSNKASKVRIQPLVTLSEVDSTITEQFRILHTKISWLNDTKSCSVFAISSALKNEGKTLTALNLAVVTARDFGKKTLLIEADFKNPKIATYLGLKTKEGLLDTILNNTNIESNIIDYGPGNFSVIPVGQSMQNSSFILSSSRLKDLINRMKERYDYIFIDCPPILSLPDVNIIERLVDSIILVVRAEKTPRNVLALATRSLQTEKLFGIVLNDVRLHSRQYRQYYSIAR